MDVLVDYNNLPRIVLNQGPKLIVERIMAVLGTHVADEKRVNVRLYDGWYQNQDLTRRAQAVSVEVAANFPATHIVPDVTTTNKKVLVNVEMAYSLKIDPVAPIWHTYRMKAAPRNLSCADPIASGCTFSPCELLSTHLFFRDHKCPNVGCTVSPVNLINRGEQ